MKGVPDYGSDVGGEPENQDESLKDIITAMRSEFRAVGRKFDAFETNLGTTQQQVEKLSEQMTKAVDPQKTYQIEARAAAEKTNSEITAIQAAQEKLYLTQTKSLQQLKDQVLKELHDKVGCPGPPQGTQHMTDVEDNNEGEWVRIAKANPKVL